MGQNSMDFNEIYSLLQNGDETDQIEAKRATNHIGQSCLETICAFSNEPDLGGGYLLLGISRDEEALDFPYTITGVSQPDTLQQEIATQCRQCFNIPIRPTMKVIDHDQGPVVLVHIPEASPHEKPVFITKLGREKGAYRRIGPTDQICVYDDLDLLYRLRSQRKLDASPVEDAALEEFDDQAIKTYRSEREKIKPNARELAYNDQDLLKSLKATITEKGGTFPTVAGVLLFGNLDVLCRNFGLYNQIDYMLIEGREWVGDPDRRYTALEICEPLMLAIPRTLRHIMNDIPQVFALDKEQLQRIDNPTMPRKVIREALINAVMHKDYHIGSPTQVIKYANRIEFRNLGFSLKPKDQLGLPGSVPRNPILANVFQNIHYDEAKGTGIQTMRDEMRKANLSVPLIETSRANNSFVLTLLSHHLFDKTDIEWLGQFQDYNLTDDEAKSLIVIREMGAINNADYRTITGVDTLTASSHLRRLRDLELIEQKRGGSATYYIPTTKLLIPKVKNVKTSTTPSDAAQGSKTLSKNRTPQTNPLSEELTPQTNPLSEELTPQANPLSEESALQTSSLFTALEEKKIIKIKKEIESLGKRAPTHKVKKIIREICFYSYKRPSDIAKILNKNARHLRDYYLKPMIDAGELEYLYPRNPVHPQQGYKTNKRTTTKAKTQ